MVDAQIPVKDLQDLSGPWECRDPNGIHGIFITHSTGMTDSGGQQTVAWQAISVFVYQRQGGKAEGGYFSPGRGGADFDGRRLMISFRGTSNLSPFNVEIEFDVVAKQWDGYWSFCDSTGRAVLERPHQADGMSADVFEGDWEGNSDPALPVSGRLHIRQALDGKVMAWLDMANTSRDLRTQVISIDESSRQLLFESVTQNRIILRLVEGIGPKFHYEGTLSADRKTISGEWRSEGAPGIQSVTGPHFLAPMLYRHVD